MSDPKLTLLLKRLHKKTLEGTIPWEKTVDEGVFHASFKGFSVRLFLRPSRDPDLQGLGDVNDLVLQIYNEEGVLVEELSDLEFRDEDFGMTPYAFMDQMYTQARRVAMGFAQAIDTLLEALND